jgi:hypothetical protein
MAGKKNLQIKMVTPNFRVSYPNVFVARANELKVRDGKPVMEYSLQALFPHFNAMKDEEKAKMTALQAAIEEVAVDMWGSNRDLWPIDKEGKMSVVFPLKSQGKFDKALRKIVFPEGHVEGALCANLKSEKKPGLVDAKRQPIIAPEDFYGGCWARAQVNISAYEKAGNCGVSLWLENVQKVAEGDPLGGRMRAEDAFEAVDDANF